MSMSSLSAQLASLDSSKGKNVGSSFSTSKRQSDAIGRGVSHSAKHGHSVQPSSARHKPSVLYADSNAASDVPLTTLRENCVSSLRQLAKLTQNTAFVSPQFLQTLAGVHSLNFERGLATRAENEKMDVIIKELLRLVSTVMGESSSTSTTSCFSSSLHVLEYLLRRYDIHARPDTAEMLLLATLPHHEQPVFSRVLQLVDLASLSTWAFLRPFAAKGSPPPNRTVLAKRATKDNTLIRHCCDMAKSASTIHASECDGRLFYTPRRGISRVISFGAAVVVEALTIQCSSHGSIAEPTLRCLLPYVLSACGDKKKGGHSLGMICADWRGFGHVMASCIAEKCILAPDAREVLATTLVKGALEMERAYEALESDVEVPTSFEAVADSLVTLMTVLSEKPKGVMDSRLIMIPPKRHSNRTGDVEWLGYALPVPTYRALVKLACLSQALGHLYADRDLVVAPLVASLIATSISRLPEDSKNTFFRVIMDLINQRQLEPLWKDTELNFTASVSAALLSMIAKLPEDRCHTTLLDNARALVDALRGACATGCDAGIAHAVTTLRESSKQPKVKQRIASILGLAANDEKADEMDVNMLDENSSTMLLPPRVALEHADSATRLDAIERLMKDPPMMESGGESLEEALLRHFLTEDDLSVVVAAGTALATLLRRKPHEVSLKFATDCLEALHEFALDEDAFLRGDGRKGKSKKKPDAAEETVSNVSDERVRALEVALEISGFTARDLRAVDHRHDSTDLEFIWDRLTEGIIAHLDLSKGTAINASKSEAAERIATQASQSLCHAIGNSNGKKTKTQNTQSLLLSSELLRNGLKSCWASSERRRPGQVASDPLFQRYIDVYLVALTDVLEKSRNPRPRKVSAEIVLDALNACLFKLRTEEPADNPVRVNEKKESSPLVRGLNECARHAEIMETRVILDAIVELASVPSQHVFDNVCRPSMNALCDAYVGTHGVSKLIMLMEVALRPATSNLAVLRLLSVASTSTSSGEQSVTTHTPDAIVSILALFGHSDQKIRKSALQLVSAITEATPNEETKEDNDGDSLMSDFVCFLGTEASNSTSGASSILLNGHSALPGFLGESVLKSKDPSKLRIELIKHCRRTACSLRSAEEEERWLTFEECAGGCRAAALTLGALELSGETCFPLIDRYKYAGQGILQALLEESTDQCVVTTTISDLIRSIARMMKGVKVIDASSLEGEISSMTISTGPNVRGTRTRSYSVGRSVGVSFISPYPKIIQDDILKCLQIALPAREDEPGMTTTRKELIRAVIEEVLGSPSWGEGVFKKMDRDSRREILSSLLDLRKAESIGNAGEALLSLPFDGKDVAHLIRGEKEEPNLSSIVFLSDYVYRHAGRLRDSTGYSELVSLLFRILEEVSKLDHQIDDTDEAEFVRQCLLSMLVALIQPEGASSADKRKKKLPKKDLSKNASFLVALAGGTNHRSEKLRQLPIGRTRSLAFTLLASLCSEDPRSIVPSLVPAMVSTVVADSSINAANRPAKIAYRAPRDAFQCLIPVFFKYSSAAGLSLCDLFNQFFHQCLEASQGEKKELFLCMVDALKLIPSSELNWVDPTSSFIAALLAFNVRNSGPSITKETASTTDVTNNILSSFLPSAQLSTVIQLVAYVNQCLQRLSDSSGGGGGDGDGDGDNSRNVSTDCSIADIESSILFQSSPRAEVLEKKDPFIMSTILGMLAVVMNSLEGTSMTKRLTKGDGIESELSLRLWQDLLLAQSTSLQSHGRKQEELTRESIPADQGDDSDIAFEKKFWDECERLIGACLDRLQCLLPAHLFLAAVASLLQDSSDAELCSRAIRLASERAEEVGADSPEASLFFDLLPMLVNLLESSTALEEQAPTDSAILVQQSVMVAVEILARSLCLQSSKDVTGRLNHFATVLRHSTRFIKEHSTPLEQQDQVLSELESPSCQLFCSSSLCASTLLRLLGARAIPMLPHLVGTLLTVLASVNDALARNPSQLNASQRSQAGVLQLSILRTLVAISDSLPQFMGPYLDQVLSPSVLLSPSLRSEAVELRLDVESAATKLEVVLSNKIPARQLIPSLCKSLPKCNRHGELKALLTMLNESIQQAQRSELPALRSWILKALTLAYEFRGSGDEHTTDLVDEANDVLVAMVMKLSEAQLRPFYAKLHEWKGDANAGTDDAAVKMFAFWSLSAKLSAELRGIFLPCLSTVVSDAVDELEFAVSLICGTTASKKVDGGKKRRRLQPAEAQGAESVRFLKPLLHCLESALHADASDGGKWVRSDDNQRYHSLLSPLSKLLELRASSIVTSPEAGSTSETLYHRIVHGVEEEPGSVIGCLTALASAAGNEQLWKPLNHAVLVACGNESRPEVRKCGVSCLLSLIKALGEEFMVLLPECLPVLSELLEDSDEEIAARAQECVTMGEELLGESLQESLR